MKTIAEALTLYENFKDHQTVAGIIDHFKLPECDYTVRLAHKIWSHLLQINSFHNGVAHLNETKYPHMANKELALLNEKLAVLKQTPLQTIHAELTRVDEIFQTTH